MIVLKTPEEIEIMALGGKILAETLQTVLQMAKAGISTKELDIFAEKLILEAGAKPSFKMEKGYYYTTCMCLNDIVVHGIPTPRKLKEGDVLGIDMGVYYQGFHTDASWTIQCHSGAARSAAIESSKKDAIASLQHDDKTAIFLKTGEKALHEAIKKCQVGNHIGDISKTIQDIVEGAGYSCVKQLVGHGVGKLLHEDPEIPCYLRGGIKNTAVIKEGMVLAVEVIYNEGKSAVVYKNDDGWSISTRDGFNSGLFEHTVAITANGPVILTSPLAHGAV